MLVKLIVDWAIFVSKRNVVRAYKNSTNVERCPVELYKNKNLSHMPKVNSDHAFYLRGFCPGQKGTYAIAIKQTRKLTNVVKSIMRKAGFEGHFTNPSLRPSCATRL